MYWSTGGSPGPGKSANCVWYTSRSAVTTSSEAIGSKVAASSLVLGAFCGSAVDMEEGVEIKCRPVCSCLFNRSLRANDLPQKHANAFSFVSVAARQLRLILEMEYYRTRRVVPLEVFQACKRAGADIALIRLGWRLSLDDCTFSRSMVWHGVSMPFPVQ